MLMNARLALCNCSSLFWIRQMKPCSVLLDVIDSLHCYSSLCFVCMEWKLLRSYGTLSCILVEVIQSRLFLIYTLVNCNPGFTVVL
jgi:hypothetical protein